MFKLFSLNSKTILSLMLLALFVSTEALAQLSVSPKRVIFEQRIQAAQLQLLNAGNKTKTYRIHFKQMRMTVQGGFEVINGQNPALNNERFANQAIRFSPRQVTLAPRASQTITVLVRKPKGFANGEYRSHLTFSELPSDDSIENNSSNDSFALQMTPLLGMSIPIIIRQGQLNQQVEIKNPSLSSVKSVLQLNLELHQLGQTSVYGELIAKFNPDDGSPALEIGKVKGVSVLTPLEWRQVVIPLNKTSKNLMLNQGSISIIYNNLEQYSSKLQPQLAQIDLRI
jgi:P pilus assembly chaperone PapD